MSRARPASLLLLALLARPTAGAQGGLSLEINRAIDRGIARVLAWQNADGSFGGAQHAGSYPLGQSALALYALLSSGVPRDDPAVVRAFAFLRQQEPKKVYSVSVWVLALDAARDPRLDAEIRDAAAWLELAFNERDDLWGYPEGDPELSNTQFAVLALWTAGRHGYAPKGRLWTDLIAGTLDVQNGDGGFGYRPTDRPESQGSMTTAGITTLELAVGALAGDLSSSKAAHEGREGLARAWSWMDRHFTATGNPSFDNGLLLDRHKITPDRLYMFHYYYVWGVERIAAISGRQAIGGRDWYREGAIQLLKDEEPEGGWAYIDTTAFALLFLKRATYSGLKAADEEALPRALTWRYTLQEPPAGWEQPDFDDTGWSEGAGSFGNWQSAFRQDRTAWEGADVWLRRAVDWDGEPSEMRLFAMHDDGIEIYLNGVLAASNPLWSEKPREYALSGAARATVERGPNLVAVHCRDTGGGRTVDVHLADRGGLAARLGTALAAEPAPWVRTPPTDAPFLCRWLVLGPLADEDHGGFDEEPVRESALRPAAGQRTRGLVWRPVRVRGPRVELAEVMKPADGAFYYAFTYLLAREDAEAVLWLGSDDGVRVWLDGELLLSHHAHQEAKPDEHPLPLRLTAGPHALLVRVENAAAQCALYARLAGLDGRVLRTVQPVLEPDAPDWAAAAAALPELHTLAELARLLPLEERERIDLAAEEDVAALTVLGAAPGHPRWHSGVPGKAGAAEAAPNPGQTGLAVMKPASNDTPARLLIRLRVPEAARLLVRFSPDARPGARAHIRVSTLEGETELLLGEATAEQADKPSKKAWRDCSADLSNLAGQDALLLVDVHGDPPGEASAEPAAVFVDQIVLER